MKQKRKSITAIFICALMIAGSICFGGIISVKRMEKKCAAYFEYTPEETSAISGTGSVYANIDKRERICRSLLILYARYINKEDAVYSNLNTAVLTL